ncbi:unnamed protein product [Malus baccata var. baccata]
MEGMSCVTTGQGEALRLAPYNVPLWPYASISSEAAAADFTNEAYSADSTLEPPENLTQETVEELLRKKNEVVRLMKMERHHESAHQIGGAFLNSGEVLEAVDPYIMYVRKEKFRKVVKNRSYGVCLAVKGLGDFGNLSAAFRFADALGFQSKQLPENFSYSINNTLKMHLPIYEKEAVRVLAMVTASEKKERGGGGTE